jgi:hypothetical protein
MHYISKNMTGINDNYCLNSPHRSSTARAHIAGRVVRAADVAPMVTPVMVRRRS